MQKMEDFILKKAILLSVSLGVLGAASPVVVQQDVRANADTVNQAPGTVNVTIHKVYHSRGIFGTHQDNQGFDQSVTLDPRKSNEIYLDDEPDYSPSHKSIKVDPMSTREVVVDYYATPAKVQVKFVDVTGKIIRDPKNYDKCTLHGQYILKSEITNIDGYKLLNPHTTEGKISSTEQTIKLVYTRSDTPQESHELKNIVTVESAVTNNPAPEKKVEHTEESPATQAVSTPESQTQVELPKASPLKNNSTLEPHNDVKLLPVPPVEAVETEKKDQPQSVKPVKTENQNQDVSKKQRTQDTQNMQNASSSATKSVDDGKSSTEQAKQAPKSVPAVSPKTDGKTESKTTANEAKHTEAAKESSVEAKADPKGLSSETKDGGDKPTTTKEDTDQTAPAEKTETPKEVPNNEGVAPAEKDLPAAAQDDAQMTTNEAKQPTKAGLVKIPQVDKKAVDEDPFLKSISDKGSVSEEKVAVDKSKKRSIRKEISSTEQYRLRGIDAHSKELFNKTVDLTKEDAADFPAKNVEFYGYDLVDSEYNKEAKTFILHYQAKKVTFHIINTDEEGKTLLKKLSRWNLAIRNPTHRKLFQVTR